MARKELLNEENSSSPTLFELVVGVVCLRPCGYLVGSRQESDFAKALPMLKWGYVFSNYSISVCCELMMLQVTPWIFYKHLCFAV
ncbi:hypothetical protein QVD17_32318 [Tagetes erecta]|uniref:Uncharacterized protein n=1 Tax=Tagetes erecta TaxID=13708 RepID=A0AAD8K5E7_TARER|nr:hypothetical protein QVD17_32318 [Tagetes erecta]